MNYTYDDIGQLHTAGGSGGQSTEDRGYTYDAGWNLNYRTNNGTLDTGGRDSRSSFYWGRPQTPHLSASNPTNFTAADYLLGRQRRWLGYDPNPA